MEIKEFRKVTKYNARSINEFVKEQNKAKEEIDNTTQTLDAKIEELNNKLEELKSKNTRKMTEDEKEEYKSEKEKYKAEKKNVEKEKKEAEKYLNKFEKERERVKLKLAEKVGKIETKIEENETKIEELEKEIKENEEKMEGMEDKKSTEYKELLRANANTSKKISRSKGNITRYNKKIEDIKEIEGNLDTWHVVDLPEIIDIKSKPRILNGKKYKKVPEKIEEQSKKLEPELVKAETDDKIAKLQEEIKQPEQSLQQKQPVQLKQPVQQKQTVKIVQPEQVKQQPVQSKQPAQTEKQVQPQVTQTIQQEQPLQYAEQSQKPYSEMTIEELEKKQRELFAKIVEDDDYYWRAHNENGMESHEEDWLDKELKAVKEEIDKRKVVNQEQPEPIISNEPEEAKKASLFEKIKEFFKKVINNFSKKDIKLLPEDTLTVSLSVDGNDERNKFVKEIRVNVGDLMNDDKEGDISELLEREEETR